jgi:hypothetical protein
MLNAPLPFVPQVSPGLEVPCDHQTLGKRGSRYRLKKEHRDLLCGVGH